MNPKKHKEDRRPRPTKSLVGESLTTGNRQLRRKQVKQDKKIHKMMMDIKIKANIRNTKAEGRELKAKPTLKMK